jgi:hypothetical protein
VRGCGVYARPAAVGFALCVAAVIGVGGAALSAQAVPIDADDIGGVVTGPTGPEHTLQPDVTACAQSIATAVRTDGAQAAAQRLVTAEDA